MTTPRTLQIQRGRDRRAYKPIEDWRVKFFAGVISTIHCNDIRNRWNGLKRSFDARRHDPRVLQSRRMAQVEQIS